jgi:hypothetical protein
LRSGEDFVLEDDDPLSSIRSFLLLLSALPAFEVNLM